MAKVADIYFKVDPWKIVEEGFDPAYSRVSESVFSLGNESMGVRGFFDEGGSVDSPIITVFTTWNMWDDPTAASWIKPIL